MKRALGSLLIILTAMLGIGAGIVFAATTGGTSVAKTVGQTALLSWTAPTSYTDGSAIASGTVISYNLYQASEPPGSTCAGATFGQAMQSGLGGTTYTTLPYASAGVYCYELTSVVNNTESAPSNIVTVTVTNPIPNPPGAVTVN